jgi:cytidine deaminase
MDGSDTTHDGSQSPSDDPAHEDTAAAVDADVDADELIALARDGLANAHVPYSEYRVGAALATADGSVYVGCNIENANYSNSLHAEEVAVGKAVSAGHREFVAIAVTSAARDGVTPCGMCRQTLAEFAPADLPVYCDEGDTVATYTLGELLPDTISLDTLEAARAARDVGDE